MEALRKDIRFLGLTSGGLAQAIGVSETTVSKWMNGINLPRPIHVVKMVEIGISKEAAIEPSKEV